MRKFISIFVIFASFSLFLVQALSSQKYQKSGFATVISETGTTLTLKVVAYAKKKKAVRVAAEKQAFQSIFFNGIDGYNNNVPLLKNPEEARVKHAPFFESFFMGKYATFIADISEREKPSKSSKKEFKGTYQISVLLNPLYRNLKNNGLMGDVSTVSAFGNTTPIEKISNPEILNNTNLPTIMVIPYIGSNESYATVLKEDFLKRSAIAVVQEGFNKKGIQTIDFEAKLNSNLRSAAFDANSQSSVQKMMIQNSGSDIYVTTDFVKEFLESGNQVTLVLKAYETSSGKVVASTKSSSGKFRTTDFNKLCEISLSKIMVDFLDQIVTNFSNKEKVGNTVVLNFSLSEEAQIDFDYIIEDVGAPLADMLRGWIKKSAKNGFYHLQGSTEKALIYDQISIPIKDDMGNPYTKSDFAFDLWSYLYNEMKIKCSKKIDGQNIYITIK